MNEVKKDFLSKYNSDEMFKIIEIVGNAERSGLLYEVIYASLNNMKNHPDSSPLLCLQIAAEDWDI